MRYNYGTCVELYTLYQTNWYVFFPMCYPWEEEAEQAIIRLDKKHTLEGNVGAKLLVLDDRGVKEKKLIFHRDNEGKMVCNLPKLLKKSGMEYEKSKDDLYCDRTPWNQKDSTSEVTCCKRGMLELVHSCYWGEQYEIRFEDRKARPVAGGKPVKIIRFNECQKGIWNEMEAMFFKIIKDPTILEYSDIHRMMRIAKPKGIQPCRLYMQTPDGYQWQDLGNSSAQMPCTMLQ